MTTPSAPAATEPARPRVANFPRQGEVHQRLTGANFTMARIGSPTELARYGVRHPAVSETIRGKLFLKELLDLTAMEISWGLMPPQTSIPFFHKHGQNEEVYLFLNGRGEFRVDDQIMEVSDGTAVRVAPDGVRSFRNTGETTMFYVVIQAKQGTLEQWTGTDGIRVPGEVTWP